MSERTGLEVCVSYVYMNVNVCTNLLVSICELVFSHISNFGLLSG